MDMLTQNELKEILNYDPETGIFTWKADKKKGTNIIPAGSIAGCKDKDGYWKIRINYKSYLAHRLAWLYVYGYIPTEIDHIKKPESDNRICNLRPASHSQNMANRVVNKKNLSGFKGVYWRKNDKKWGAKINFQCKSIHLGIYSTSIEAAKAYDAKAKELYGEYALLNFPEEDKCF